MPAPPALASGRHEVKRPRPLPKPVRSAITLMVEQGIDYVEAARACGIKPENLRLWFDRPLFLQALRAQRKAWREAGCAGNETALLRVRNTSENGMAVIGAVRGLEDLAEREVVQTRGTQQTPGLVIQIISPTPLEPKPVAAAIEDEQPLEPELDP
jgi:hypothetical protein